MEKCAKFWTTLYRDKPMIALKNAKRALLIPKMLSSNFYLIPILYIAVYRYVSYTKKTQNNSKSVKNKHKC